MTATAEKLKTELAGLSAADRANLAHFLIQSLPPPTMTDSELDAELENRSCEILGGKAKGEPVEDVIEELRAKFS